GPANRSPQRRSAPRRPTTIRSSCRRPTSASAASRRSSRCSMLRRPSAGRRRRRTTLSAKTTSARTTRASPTTAPPRRRTTAPTSRTTRAMSAPSAASPATDAACALLDALASLGVRHVVVSPGSRSQALALAAAEMERRGRIRLHVRIDERQAGFTALGIGRESRVPAAVICTSGTAVANLLPAALEAHHSGVPLILLTADRPPELRGVGANQTTRQPGLFGDAARFADDAPVPVGDPGERAAFRTLAARAFAAAAGETVQGVAHLNLPFREPLAGEIPEWFGGAEDDDALADAVGAFAADPGEPTTLEQGPRTVVVAGADAGAEAELIARRGGWPLLAEIVSGSRFGRRAIRGYREALRREALGGRIERVVVVGHPTLHREVTRLLSRADVEIVALRATDEPLDLSGSPRAADAIAVAPGEIDRDWLGAWQDWSRDRPDARADGLDRARLVEAVWRATGEDDRLVFGSSRLVRVADDVLEPRAVRVHANRGLAGIDGTIATATGIALASGRITRVLVGDLTFLHDAGSLLLPDGEERPRVQVVVGNDRGGTI